MLRSLFLYRAHEGIMREAVTEINLTPSVWLVVSSEPVGMNQLFPDHFDLANIDQRFEKILLMMQLSHFPFKRRGNLSSQL